MRSVLVLLVLLCLFQGGFSVNRQSNVKTVAKNVARRHKAKLTPAETLALPANTGKTTQEKLKLFCANDDQKAAVDTLYALGAPWSACFDALVAAPPLKTPDIIRTITGIKVLRTKAALVAASLSSIVRRETVAENMIGFKVHPHDFVDEGDSVPAKTTKLEEQFDRDLGDIGTTYTIAAGKTKVPEFWDSFTVMADATCYVGRINTIRVFLGSMTKKLGDNEDASGTLLTGIADMADRDHVKKTVFCVTKMLTDNAEETGIVGDRIGTIVQILLTSMIIEADEGATDGADYCDSQGA